MLLETALDYARTHRDAFLEQFKALIGIPSISTLPEHQADVRRAAEWIAEELRRLGMQSVQILPTPLHPIVYGDYTHDAGKPTLLVYGHYDVQPVDPIEEWLSDPFTATLRGENLYARGASDMKGGIVGVLKAVEALKQAGELPVNLKFLFEGEEEVGSPSLPAFIDAHRDLLRAGMVLNCDGGIHGPELPSITYSLRGLAYFEIEVRGPRQDLHSGIFGGSLHNPAQVLCELIAGMHDADGRVTLPGFYDNVLALQDEERRALARAPITDEDWKAMAGVTALWGEKGYTTVERTGARPTLEVNGIIGGFTGTGAKTVLPAKASAKISMRLVARQEPAEIGGQLRRYLRERAPETVTWEVREHSRAPWAIMDRRSIPIRAAVNALRETFGVEPVFKREGGSVPIVGMMQETLKSDSVLMGFALPDDGIHGPNEKQHLPTWYKGIDTYIRFLTGLGENPEA